MDENNFSYDTAAILEYVQNIILEHLKRGVFYLSEKGLYKWCDRQQEHTLYENIRSKADYRENTQAVDD